MAVLPASLLVMAGSPTPDAPARLRAEVEWLSSDAMQGRDPARPEYPRAARHVADAFAAAGLRPATGDGYLQPVPLVRYRPAGPGSMDWTPSGGTMAALRPGIDFHAEADPGAPRRHVVAPVVFVGHGIVAPRLGIDEYRGVDVRGKIVAVRFGGPDTGDPVDRALLWDQAAKRRTAQARGAIGFVTVHVDQPGAASFATSAKAAAYPQTSWVDADGNGGTGPAATPLLATLSETGAERLFGPAWQRRGRPIAPAGRLAIDTATLIDPVPSVNVVGLLPGSDPRLSREVVVVSAHLDHIGVTPPGPGDQINNGALDNAIGVSILLEIARTLSARKRHPRRSILFLATTGEETGLLGSDYFATHPTKGSSIIANTNIDMPILTYRFTDIIAFGAGYSTLSHPVHAAARRAGVAVSHDPEPQHAFYARSDQFSFAKRGIPAVMLWPGRRGEGQQATELFMETRYHRPSDDSTQGIRWDQAARYSDIIVSIVRNVADARRQPSLSHHGARFAPTEALGSPVNRSPLPAGAG